MPRIEIIHTIVILQWLSSKRGETNLHWKERHLDKDLKNVNVEFLTEKFGVNEVNNCRQIHQNSGPRGVNLVKLLPLMLLTYKILISSKRCKWKRSDGQL